MILTENDRIELIQHYQQIRQQTETICIPLEIEDYVIQGMDDVSPAKWHLAHTTWFFETLILIPNLKNYKIFDPLFQDLFNSYYQSLGTPYPRLKRGLLSRPTVKKIYDYRHAIDDQIQHYLLTCSIEQLQIIEEKLIIGFQHEQQHQELLLMDIKYNYSLNPEYPAYSALQPQSHTKILKETFIPVEGIITTIGFRGNGFSYDNESPPHSCILSAYNIANRLVTAGEYLEFIQDGGYKNPLFWLSDGWDWVVKNHQKAPLYWINLNGQWKLFTLNGLVEINTEEPISHVNYYEADAYARWRGMRLPTEMEWEHFVTLNKLTPEKGNFLENKKFHPQPIKSSFSSLTQFFGDVWEWTCSNYSPYPGYKPYTGALGEYNGKFMCNQMVLRGGSCVTPKSHIRATYRNFFYPDKQWAFSGFRLVDNKS